MTALLKFFKKLFLLFAQRVDFLQVVGKTRARSAAA